MHWYEGNVAEAVSLSKQRNAIFVVFVEGNNDLSTEMSTILNNGSITTKLSDETNFLAVKLKSGSVDYTHFAQIYQFVPVPSLFFIGRNGTPLEVICAGVQPENLATRIDRILEEHRKETPAKPSTSATSLKEQTQNLIQSETAATSSSSSSSSKDKDTPGSSASATRESTPEPAPKVPKIEHEVTKSGVEYEVVCDGDVCVRRPKTSDPGPSQRNVTPDEPMKEQQRNVTPNEPSKEQLVQEAPPPESTASMEEKLERAKELIEVKKREKEEKEKQLAKQKELERRATGQGVAELKRWQADQELKQIQEERKREKLENNLARQRILEQIAQDRAERRARDTPAAPATPAPTLATANSTGGDATASVSARVQFKLPDGTSHTANFNADDTLRIVQRYVADNLQLPSSSFSLWTAFPRRELVEVDETLRELQLAPSAALLVVARRQPGTIAPTSHVANFISFLTTLFSTIILQPAQNAYDWIYSRFFPTGGSSGSNVAPETRPEPRPNTPGVRYRPRTNIHRLTGDRPGDDDNNTWNGNSTQQM